MYNILNKDAYLLLIKSWKNNSKVKNLITLQNKIIKVIYNICTLQQGQLFNDSMPVVI